MRTQRVYETYQTPKNLREHMLRVAALAEIILEHWTGKALQTEAIVQACLFHDIAKPIHFDLSKQAEFGMSPRQIAHLEALQKRLTARYGSDEHQVTVQIVKDIGCLQTAVRLVNNFEWKYVPRLLRAGDIESLIPIYCDMRIGPKGIMVLQDRVGELKVRDHDTRNWDELLQAGEELERKLEQFVNIDLHKIEDRQLTSCFDHLLNLEI